MKHESLEGNVNLVHSQKVVLIGSCFSNNLAPKFQDSGFETWSNPLGTIFHPLALSQAIRSAFSESTNHQIFQRDDIWFDWRAASTIYGMSYEEMQRNIELALDSLKSSLLNSRLLVVTFGTAWGYYLNSGQVVANCHKMPIETFEKRMSSLEELFQEWKEVLRVVKEKNPDIKVVFTVSPIEHVKDGLVGNSRSKARLIELCSLLEEEGADYFHSYELVRSMFRELRFYESDQLHLNPQAIEILWQHAAPYFIQPESIAISQKVVSTNSMRTHKPIHPESKAARELEGKIVDSMASLSKKHPGIYWKQE